MRSLLICLILFIVCPIVSIAQEFDCDVTITNLETLQADARDNLSDFIQQVKQYYNSRRWTSEDFNGEKIRWTMNISFMGATGNHYTAQAFIGSQRPIYKTNRNTACTRILDDKWEFDYIRNQSLIYSDIQYDPLLSFLDFYAYVVLGYDADTYTTMSGTKYFQKAANIVDRARGSGGASKGWEVSPQGSYSRAQLVEELLSPKFGDFRRAIHVYYYRGLDSLALDQEKALKKMLRALENIGKLREKINQQSVSLRIFFDTKYLEIAESFLSYPDKSVFAQLEKIDPAHLQVYDQYSEKKK